jgi:hypothetical protein
MLTSRSGYRNARSTLLHSVETHQWYEQVEQPQANLQQDKTG